MRDWQGDSVLSSVYCSHRGPGLVSSTHIYRQITIVIPSPGGSDTLGLQGHLRLCAYAWMQMHN